MNQIIDNLIFPFDYIILTIILIIIIICFLKGLVNSILSILTWVGSVLITIYTYESLSNLISKQMINMNLFQKNEYITHIISTVISIPIIFLISLFILKRIRKFLNSDFDKQLLGIILDKFFGIIYGIMFSYISISATIILLNKFEYNSVNNWLTNNSSIILNVQDFNNKYTNPGKVENAVETLN